MGVVEVIPTPENAAKAWVLFNGQLVCTDPAFNDWWVGHVFGCFQLGQESLVGMCAFCFPYGRRGWVLRCHTASHSFCGPPLPYSHMLLPWNTTHAYRFAYKPEEVVGTALSTYVVEYKRLEEIIRIARMARMSLMKKAVGPSRRSMDATRASGVCV